MAENTATDNNAVSTIGQGGVVSYQCPQCGGPLSFGESGTVAKCEHCGTEVQRTLPPVKLTEPMGQSDSDDSQRRYGGGQMGGFGMMGAMMWFPLFMALIASHSAYTSAYTGMGAAHPAHAHGVGGFMG
ncbi:MAG TPA: hypothetical protein VK487_09455 [Candidatus Bathyarchaeia archaeon]|nr:hypothetical protein [Candidatus Bathyarchaeia archaeon]